MTQPERIFVSVDRLERGNVVLVSDDGETYEVPPRQLPQGVVEGSVLSVLPGDDGQLLWKNAVIDATETQRRTSELKERLDKLKRTDGGGDIRL